MFFSREEQVAALDTALERGARSDGSCLVLEGPAGVGLTRLLDACTRRASGWRVLRARADADEADIPYAVLAQLLEPALADLDGLTSDQRDALDVVLGHRAQGSEPVAVPSTTVRATALLAEERPVLVLVDDVQWADPSSARALAYLARRTGGTRVVVVMTLALGHALSAPARAALGTAGTTLDVPRLLDRDASTWLGAALPDLPTRTRDRLVRVARGLPRRLEDVVAVARAAPDPERPLAGMLDARPPTPTGHRLSALLGALDPLARRALLAAAVAPRRHAGLLVEALGRSGWSADDAAPLLEQLERTGAVGAPLGSTSARTVDPLVAEVVTSAAPAADLQAVHAAWAEVLAPDHPGAALAHRVQAQVSLDDDLVQEVAAEVARRAVREPLAAARLAELAAIRCPPRGSGGALRAAAAELLWLTGEAGRSRALLDQAEAGAADGPVPATATGAAVAATRARLSALEAYGVDDVAGARAHLTRCLSLEASVDPDGASRDLVLLHLLGRRGPATGLPDDVRSRLTGGARTVVDALDVLALPWEGTTAERRHAAFDVALATARSSAFPAFQLLLEVALLLGRDDELLSAVDERLDAPTGLGSGLVVADAHLARAGGTLWRGPVELAEHHLDRACEAAGSGPAAALVRAVATRQRLLVRAIRSASPSTTVGSPASDEPEPVGERVSGAGAASWTRAQAAAARGEIDAAGGHLLALWSVDGNRSAWTAALVTATDLVSHLTRLPSRPDALAMVLAEVSAWSRGSDAPIARCIEALCLGLAAPRASDREALLARATQVSGVPLYFRARAELMLGESLRRARRGVAAREHLQRAADLFSAQGHVLHAARARLELAATAPQRPGRPLGSRTLTAQEQRVAGLAGDGLSNAQIAAALSISARTVAHHLQRVYAKTGLAGRRALAERRRPEDAAS